MSIRHCFEMYFAKILDALFAHRNVIPFLILSLIYIEATTADSAAVIKPSGKQYNQNRYDYEVSRMYQHGMESYNQVLGRLSRMLDRYDGNGDMPLEINPRMKNDIQRFLDKMTLADRNIKILIMDADLDMVRKTEKISYEENRIFHSNALVEEAKVRIKGAEKKVQLAKAKKRTLEANLKTHEEALRLAKERKDKARHECLQGKRRRKRGLFKKLKKIHRKIHGHHRKVHRKITDKLPGGNIDRKIHEIVETGACELLNVITGDIEKEKKAVDDIKDNIALENKRLASATKELDLALYQRQRFTEALGTHKNAIKYHTERLERYKKGRDMMIEVSAKLKNANTLVSSIKSRAEVVHFNTELGFLLDVTGIVDPLTEIGQIVLDHDTRRNKPNSYSINILPERIDQMKVKLAQISAKRNGQR